MDIRERQAREEGAVRHPWERARLEIVDRLLLRTPTPDVLLDVGCGDAFVLAALAARGRATRLIGVDPAALAVGPLPGGSGAEVVRDLSAVDPKAGAVTHVLLLDVLEHVEDDAGLLRSVLTHPAVQGGPGRVQVLVTVPAHPGLFTEHDRVLGHHRRYTRESLLSLLENQGLTVIEEGGLFSSLVVPRALERAREQFRPGEGKSSGLSRWRGGPRITAAIERALLADFAVGDRLRRAGWPVPGLSHFALCRA